MNDQDGGAEGRGASHQNRGFAILALPFFVTKSRCTRKNKKGQAAVPELHEYRAVRRNNSRISIVIKNVERDFQSRRGRRALKFYSGVEY